MYPEEDVCSRTRSKVSVQFSGDFHGISVPSRLGFGIWISNDDNKYATEFWIRKTIDT